MRGEARESGFTENTMCWEDGEMKVAQEAMTERERFLRYMGFRSVDRIPLMEMGFWTETLERWHHEGLPKRYVEDFDEDLHWRWEQGEIVGINFHGFFGFLRDLMGLENACMAFYDHPHLVRRIIADRVQFAKELLTRVLITGALSFVQIWEDMAYASGRDGVDAVLRHVQPLLQEGAYIPFLDHFVPPDVSYDTYLYYVDRRRELLDDPSIRI